MSSTPIDPLTFTYVFQPDRVRSTSETDHNATGKSRSFLEALSDTTHDSKQDRTSSTCEPTYVHPLVRKLSTKLSEKSLEMCTESLGSETGNDIMDDHQVIDSFSTMIHRKKDTKFVGKTKREFKYNFPPPLTSLENSVCMESYRENGRLVMNAVVRTDTSDSLFHTERSNGRLRLRLKRGCFEEGDENEGKFEVAEGDFKTKDGQEAEDEGLNGNMEIMKGSNGIDENVSRVGRCNEGSGERRVEGHLWNVETCWVAT